MTDIYFEDLNVGDTFKSPGRTVTQVDVVAFAGLSGDYMPLHTDIEYGKSTMYGEPIAHGLLGLSIASGLFTRTKLATGFVNAVMALLGLEWKFTGPIKFNDTIHVSVKVIDKRETSKPDRGIITLERSVINQRGETVQIGKTPVMIKRRTD